MTRTPQHGGIQSKTLIMYWMSNKTAINPVSLSIHRNPLSGNWVDKLDGVSGAGASQKGRIGKRKYPREGSGRGRLATVSVYFLLRVIFLRVDSAECLAAVHWTIRLKIDNYKYIWCSGLMFINKKRLKRKKTHTESNPKLEI